MITKALRLSVGSVLSAAFLAGTATAGTTSATFNFEDQPLSASPLTTLSVTSAGLTAAIDRVGQPFNVVDLSALPGTSAFGTRSLAPTPPGGNFFNVNFSQPISSFSAQMGDFGNGVTDNLAITAFTGPNGTGTNLGTTSASLVLSDATTMGSKTLQIVGTNIRSVEMIGGTAAGANSVFYDNLSATFASGAGGTGGPPSVPLPSALMAAPLGALAAMWAARRMKIRPA